MRPRQDNRIEPSALTSDSLKGLSLLSRDEEPSNLFKHSGEKVTLPSEPGRLSAFTLKAPAKNQLVCLISEEEPFAAQATAKFPGKHDTIADQESGK